PERREPGVAGELWSVHGGGFYRVVKYTIAPGELPRTLHWFKWEAYATWLTGFALLVLVYYVGAASFLVDPQIARLSPGAGVAVGVAALIVSWLVYDALCRSALGARPLALAATLFVLATALAWGLAALLVQPAEPGPEERLDPPRRGARTGRAGARYGATVGSRVVERRQSGLVRGRAPDRRASLRRVPLERAHHAGHPRRAARRTARY